MRGPSFQLVTSPTEVLCRVGYIHDKSYTSWTLPQSTSLISGTATVQVQLVPQLRYRAAAKLSKSKILFASIFATHTAHTTHSWHATHSTHASHSSHTRRHPAHFGAGRHRGRNCLARRLGDRRFGGEHHRGRANRVLQRRAHDLGRIDHTGFDQVFEFPAGGIEAEVALALDHSVVNHSGLEACVARDLA